MDNDEKKKTWPGDHDSKNQLPWALEPITVGPNEPFKSKDLNSNSPNLSQRKSMNDVERISSLTNFAPTKGEGRWTVGWIKGTTPSCVKFWIKLGENCKQALYSSVKSSRES